MCKNGCASTNIAGVAAKSDRNVRISNVDTVEDEIDAKPGLCSHCKPDKDHAMFVRDWVEHSCRLARADDAIAFRRGRFVKRRSDTDHAVFAISCGPQNPRRARAYDDIEGNRGEMSIMSIETDQAVFDQPSAEKADHVRSEAAAIDSKRGLAT